MLETLEAQRLERVISAGRTRPLVVECSRSASPINDEDPDASNGPENRVLHVVKGFDLPEITNLGLFNEVFGNLLARELDIDTPAPCLVHLSTPFVEAANNVLRRYGLRLKTGIASGCEYFSGGYSNVIPRSLSDDELKQATLIYGFDMLVQNPDRTVQRPNCAIRSGHFKLFDFETTFSFVLLIGVQKPALGSLQTWLGPEASILCGSVKKKARLELETVHNCSEENQCCHN